MMLAMSIGVAAVVVLTALGDGARRYVVNEFSALGASLLIVLIAINTRKPLDFKKFTIASSLAGATGAHTLVPPLTVALGMTGRRFDHTLAALDV